MKRIILIALFLTGCPLTKEEKRDHTKKQLDCFIHKKHCFCYMTSITHMGYEVYSPTWAPIEVCEGKEE